MDPRFGGGQLPLDDEATTFQEMVKAYARTSKDQPTIFLKHSKEITGENLPPTSSRCKSFSLADRVLVDQFTRIWPSPKTMLAWVQESQNPHIKGNFNQFFCGRGFYTFLLKSKEDRDMIFHINLYFMGARGMYLNRWSLDFNLENDIPFVLPI
jgi:hypothetical protein